MSKEHCIDALVAFFENLTPESVAQFPGFYAEDACFKDPFNEVRGVPAIQRIFTHMYQQLSEPRFAVLERIVDEHGAVLVWDLSFRFRSWERRETQRIRGVSHLKFNAAGKVVWHRDYWDAAEELYAKLPAIGSLMRGLKKIMAS